MPVPIEGHCDTRMAGEGHDRLRTVAGFYPATDSKVAQVVPTDGRQTQLDGSGHQDARSCPVQVDGAVRADTPGKIIRFAERCHATPIGYGLFNQWDDFDLTA